jgi:hypothetical protein
MPVTFAYKNESGIKFYSNDRIRRLLLSCGILSSLLYVAMLIFVPMQYNDYNSASQTISELSAIGAPTRTIWVILGILYTLLIAAFGWGVRQSAIQNRKLRVAGNILFAYGIIGLGWTFAPMHQREVLAAGEGNLSDTMHLVMGAISSSFMLASMGFAAAAYKNWFSIFSIATIIIMLVFGVLTSLEQPDVKANLPTPSLGIIERIRVGIFLPWTVVLALILLKKEKTSVPVNIKKP